MQLRAFQASDAAAVCTWLRTETELYQWSADRFNKFPLTAEDIMENYTPQIASGRFFPFTAADEMGNVLGHFIIRYPREDDDTTVRFGFVIVDPAQRGKGSGREMLRLGIRYAAENLYAQRMDLGVFANNPAAQRCYEALGFREYQRRICAMPVGEWECIDMELYQKNGEIK
ncbi:MAG: GNAT family N-acetyltransferase [Oscillospiraceae bacterium]|nr:GNAT family N-acetyltransferase [Oscillospiraceae bacterium]